MVLEVRLFATLRRCAPEGSNGVVMLNVPDGTTVNELLEKLEIHPDEAKIIMINGVQAEITQTMSDGDRVGIFPPVGGG